MITIIKKAFWAKQSPVFSSILAGFIAGIILMEILVPQTSKAEFLPTPASKLALSDIVKNGHLTICKLNRSSYEVVKTVKMMVTAYSSTEDQTDDTPFITASGKQVADGIVANNMLPFGAKIRIPALYGDKIFVVEDRMHQRKGKYHVDIWLPETQQAKKFGAKLAYIEVVEN